MLIRRVIPVLDVQRGRLVKGMQFGDLHDAGDPVAAGCLYGEMGADALIVLNIGSDPTYHDNFLDQVSRLATCCQVPVIAGGGVKDEAGFGALLDAGASAVSVASAAIRDPGLVERLAREFGSEQVLTAVDARWAGTGWRVHSDGGRRITDLDAIEWCERLESMGAGQIMLVSMDRDGTGAGFDTDLVRYVGEKVQIPLIVAGGAGRLEDFVDACRAGASAVTAASLFHFRSLTIHEVKEALCQEGFGVGERASLS